MPFAIMVEFDRYSGQTIDGRVTIVPITSGWTHGGNRVHLNSTAIGLSLGSNGPQESKNDPGGSRSGCWQAEFAFGISYAGCSRVRAQIEMLIDPMFTRDRIQVEKRQRLSTPVSFGRTN